jgi:O-antigen ligase
VEIVKQRFRRMSNPDKANHIATWRGKSAEHFIFYVLIAYLFVCFIGGGSNRANINSLMYLRPLTVVSLIAMLMAPVRWNFQRVKVPLLFVGLAALLMLVQLIPLPPSIWTQLPARAPFAEASVALGGQQPWRPVSLTPDLTVNSLLALLVPLTVLVGFSGIRQDQRSALVLLIIVAVVGSAVLGVVQFAGGQEGSANLYARHSLDAPNGVFANRNHQAVFIACGLVLIATWLRLSEQGAQRRRYQLWSGALIVPLLLAVSIATGSRSGTLLVLLALCYFASTTIRSVAGAKRRGSRRGLIVQSAVLLLAGGLVGAMLFAGRAVSIDRLVSFDPSAEQRIKAFPTLMRMWRDLMPVGSGFGSFDPTFRMFEPDALLHPAYFNHAHNDWLEVSLAGGVPALVLLAAFVIWAVARIVQSFRSPTGNSTLLARAGGLVLLILGAASLTDYPVRTPLLAAVVALGCAWLESFRYDLGAAAASNDEARA